MKPLEVLTQLYPEWARWIAFVRSHLLEGRTVFRAILGPDVSVERTDHILARARRCAYQMTKRRSL